MNREDRRLLSCVIGYMDGITSNVFVQHDNRLHIKCVDYYIQVLAEDRGLDTFIGRLMALLHDVGRMKDSKQVGGHSLRSADIGEQLLLVYGLDDYRRSLIYNGIKNHGKKKQVHDVYSELLKDADSLAHREEGVLTDFETLRCDYAYREKLVCQWVTPLQYDLLLMKLVTKLETLIGSLNTDEDIHEKIHDIRVTIRKIRALCWLVKNSGLDVDLRPIILFESKLKFLFKSFEKPRELYIFQKNLSSALNNQERKIIENKLVKKIKKLKATYKTYSVTDDMASEISCIKAILEGFSIKISSPNFVVRPYLDALENVAIDNVKSLHALRIKGKTLKYLYSMGCITFDEEIYKQILRVHDAIGDYHDAEVNGQWIQKLSFDHGLLKLCHQVKRKQLKAIKPLLNQLKIQTKVYL